MSVMEKYAKNLEKMVESRTEELMLERQRADQLLDKMLPKLVEGYYQKGFEKTLSQLSHNHFVTRRSGRLWKS
jgi:uncharacterized membrane protein YgcG